MNINNVSNLNSQLYTNYKVKGFSVTFQIQILGANRQSDHGS